MDFIAKNWYKRGRFLLSSEDMTLGRTLVHDFDTSGKQTRPPVFRGMRWTGTGAADRYGFLRLRSGHHYCCNAASKLLIINDSTANFVPTAAQKRGLVCASPGRGTVCASAAIDLHHQIQSSDESREPREANSPQRRGRPRAPDVEDALTQLVQTLQNLQQQQRDLAQQQQAPQAPPQDVPEDPTFDWNRIRLPGTTSFPVPCVGRVQRMAGELLARLPTIVLRLQQGSSYSRWLLRWVMPMFVDSLWKALTEFAVRIQTVKAAQAVFEIVDYVMYFFP